jgi:CrcB protein
MDILFVGIAGFVGAIARYFIYLLEPSIQTTNFPYATLIINLSGCLLAGLLFGFAARATPEYKHYITLTLIGFVGSYTTFSTFSAETLKLLETSSYLQASFNITAHVIGGVAMVWIGRSLT